MKTVQLPDELHQKLKLECVRQGIKVAKAVEQAVKLWLAESSAGNKPQSSLSHTSQSAGAKPEFSSSGSSMPSWIVQDKPEPLKRDSLEADREYYEKLFSQAAEADI